jgi:hypothetical protein
MEPILPAQEVRLSDIITLADTLDRVLTDIDNLKASLAEKEIAKKRISETLLPDIMGQIGVTEIKLTGGRKVVIKDDIYTSAPEAKIEAITEWLNARNMGSIIKTKPSIHHSTLKAFVKEQLAVDPEFPRELFGVHEVQKATISG